MTQTPTVKTRPHPLKSWRPHPPQVSQCSRKSSCHLLCIDRWSHVPCALSPQASISIHCRCQPKVRGRSPTGSAVVSLLAPSGGEPQGQVSLSPVLYSRQWLQVLLGIGAFEALLPAQQLVLMELLPLVDRPLSGRLQPVALSNSFFGSACREWQDQLALSLHGNTAGRRGEKKNRNVSWKNSFFESEWGERSGSSDLFCCQFISLCVYRQLDAEKREAIFFPCDPNPPFSQCLSAILSGYHSKSVPPSPSPPLPGPSHPAHQRMVPEETGRLNNSSKRSGKPQTLHSQPPSTPKTKREALQSRNCSRLPSPAKRAPGKNHLVLCNKKKVNKSMFLSPLPHKMSYAALIDALHKASQQSSPHHLAVTSDPSPPAQHSHSVFHDHFSTLRASSVPTCFLSSPLLVSLPRSLLTNLLRQRAISSEHNYTPFTSDPHLKSLPLSLPRAFLPSSPPSHSSAACSSQRLTLCSTCNALYHLDCSHGNLCPSCTMPRTTPLC